MTCVSDRRFACGVFDLPKHAPGFRPKQELGREGKLLLNVSVDRPERTSHPRTTHSGVIYGVAGPGWHHVFGHTGLCVRLRAVIEPDMARFEQAGPPRPHSPRLVALRGTVHWPTNCIGGKSQTRLFN